jgi:hypothetical protein
VLRQGGRDANGTLFVLSPETSAALRRYFVEVVAVK